MSSGKASREKGEDSLSMSGEAGEDIGAGAIDTPDNANVFCRVGKRNEIFIDFYWRNSLPILNKLFLSWWTKKKFCLLRYLGIIVPLTVLKCKDDQVPEPMQCHLLVPYRRR